MNISELIKDLQAIKATEGDIQVMILDGFNGGGTPRTINKGPSLTVIRQGDAARAADCEGRVGEKIVCMGYGCY